MLYFFTVSVSPHAVGRHQKAGASVLCDSDQFADTRRHLRPPTVTYLSYRVSGSTLMAVGRSQLLALWPGTHSRILSGIQRAEQTVLGVYLERTSSRVTLLVHPAHYGFSTIMRYTNPRTHSLTHSQSIRKHSHTWRSVC